MIFDYQQTVTSVHQKQRYLITIISGLESLANESSNSNSLPRIFSASYVPGYWPVRARMSDGSICALGRRQTPSSRNSGEGGQKTEQRLGAGNAKSGGSTRS